MNRPHILFASALLLAGALAPLPARAALTKGATTAVTSDPVNDVCPVMGGDVDKESPTVAYRGREIGFCCAGCEKKWNAKPEAEKLAFLVKYVPDAAENQLKPAETGGTTATPAIRTARAYLAACGTSDTEALNALFLDNGRATVSENASDEGTWETYRDHHLLPELKEMPGFVMTVTKEDVQTFGTTSIVRQIGSFTVPDPNHKEITKKYLAAVTYVVVDEGGTPKIAHLHWSSRAEKKPVAAESTMPDAGHGHQHK